MKSFKKLLMLSVLATVFALVGCGAQKTEEGKPELNTKTSPIEVGSNNMKTAIKEMKAQLTNKEEDKAIATSEKLEENWSSIEDAVKSKSPTLYEKVEGPLGVIQGGVKIKPLDTKTIINAADTLDNVLTEIQNLK
jgi:hypothetical protein